VAVAWVVFVALLVRLVSALRVDNLKYLESSSTAKAGTRTSRARQIIGHRIIFT
jgi:hypothetical protein